MIKKNNKKKVIEEINQKNIIDIFNIIPNMCDKILNYVEKEFNIIDLIKKVLIDKRKYESKIKIELLFLAGISAKLKQQHAISEMPLAITCNRIIDKLDTNVYYDNKESILKESNIRAILNLYETNVKETNDFNNEFIVFFNDFNKLFLETAEVNSNIHILDCSILDVNYNNENYEGSTTTEKGGKKLRGYKIAALRGITPNGGVIEEISMSSAKDNDFKMSKDFVLNSKYLKPGDYLLEDRGFLDIEQIKELNQKEIKVIIPAKKNMEIYVAAVEAAKSKDEWIKHPNSKRKGQEITLIENMESFYLTQSDQKKKIENLDLDYKLNCCVIRFDLNKNKDLLTDEEVISTDKKYAYAVIMTNDINLPCQDIIRMYEQRPEIEEDFRQLKDFWGLNEFKSTKYTTNSFSMICTLIGYNFYQIYKESEEGSKYIGKSLIVEQKHGFYVTKGVTTAIITDNYFAIFNQAELLDLYADLSKEKRELIKNFLIL